MNFLKKLMVMLIVVSITVCIAGCGNDIYDNFKPAGVYLLDRISNDKYEYVVDDKEFVTTLWNMYKDLNIEENPAAEISQSYLFFKFFNRNGSVEAVFTIYDNGTCCLGYDYETLYTVENGRTAYVEMVDYYETYNPEG